MKKCSSCKVEKAETEFYKHTSHRLQGSCKVCQNERGKRLHSENKVANNARVRNNHLKKKYGITSEQYEEMLKAQGGVCWICNKPPKTHRLAVDHNHKTGQVRGLLCYWCNHRLLPAAREDAGMLLKASEYLNKFNKP